MIVLELKKYGHHESKVPMEFDEILLVSENYNYSRDFYFQLLDRSAVAPLCQESA